MIYWDKEIHALDALPHEEKWKVFYIICRHNDNYTRWNLAVWS